MKRLLSLGSLIISCICLSSSTFAATMINGGYVRTEIYGGGYANLNLTTFDTHQLLDVTRGDYYSRVQADYTQSVGGETFSNIITQKRGGVQSDYSQAYQQILFTVDVATTYEISGYFESTDVGSPGQVFLFAYLYSYEMGQYLFHNQQYSDNTANESFTLGQTGGENSYLQGNLSGTLAAGSYQFYWAAVSQAYPELDEGASAVGNVTLKLGSGGTLASVPEPTSIAIWSLGLVGMTFACRHRRTR